MMMVMMSVSRPVSTPPTEVASRQPWAVVSNSHITCRCAEGRIAKELPVPAAGDDLPAIARQFVGEVLAPGYARDGPVLLKGGSDAEDLALGS